MQKDSETALPRGHQNRLEVPQQMLRAKLCPLCEVRQFGPEGQRPAGIKPFAQGSSLGFCPPHAIPSYEPGGTSRKQQVGSAGAVMPSSGHKL